MQPRRRPPGETRRRILEYVSRRILEGRAPTVREVQQVMGLRAVQSVQEHLDALVAQGLLLRDPGARGYRLPGRAEAPVRRVPVLGRVQAGALTLALEEPEGHLDVHARSAEDELFALRVRGDSMIGAGILEGDLVIVRRQAAADSGDVVVALVGDEATVKTLRRRRGRVELHAENPAYPPIVPPPGEGVLLGKVVEVRRYLDGAPPIAAPPRVVPEAGAGGGAS